MDRYATEIIVFVGDINVHMAYLCHVFMSDPIN